MNPNPIQPQNPSDVERQALLERFREEAKASGTAELLINGFSPEFITFLKEQYKPYPAGSEQRRFLEQFLDPMYVAMSIQNLEPLPQYMIDENVRDCDRGTVASDHAALNNFWLRFNGASRSAAEPAFVRLVYSEPELVAKISPWAVLYRPCRKAAFAAFNKPEIPGSRAIGELCDAMERDYPVQDLKEAYRKGLNLIDRRDLGMDSDHQTIEEKCKVQIYSAGIIFTR